MTGFIVGGLTVVAGIALHFAIHGRLEELLK